MPVSDPAAQLWNQHHTQPPMAKMPMPVKQQFYMPSQEHMKLFEHPMPPAVPMQPPQHSIDKKMNFQDVKMQDFYWEPPYRMNENRANMGDRMIKHQPGVFCPEQDSTPRVPPYEVCNYLFGFMEERLHLLFGIVIMILITLWLTHTRTHKLI